MKCEVCGVKITKKNFWKHKHSPYTQLENEEETKKERKRV